LALEPPELSTAMGALINRSSVCSPSGVMAARMISDVKQLKVLKAVVSLVAVDMVNLL